MESRPDTKEKGKRFQYGDSPLEPISPCIQMLKFIEEVQYQTRRLLGMDRRKGKE